MIDWIVYQGNVYYGETDEKKIPNGHGTLKCEELTFEGNFAEGKMEGLMNVKDREGYRFQAIMRGGEVIDGKICGEVEELILDVGVYHGGVDEQMLPYGEGEFILPDGTAVRGTWDEEGLRGPYVKTSLKGSVEEGIMDHGRSSGFTRVRFCSGDTIEGYVISEEEDDGIYTRFDTIDLYRSKFSGNEECPDEVFSDHWDDYMAFRKHPDTIYKDSKIEIMYMHIFHLLHERSSGYGLLQFRKDGVYIRDSWHGDEPYEKICPYPYCICSDEEVSYFTDRFYEEYHLHILIMNDSGRPNEFQWVCDYEIAMKIGAGEDLL